MPKKIDMIGLRFGRLVVIEDAPNLGNERTFVCECDCGRIANHIRRSSLTSGRTRSCGCLSAEMTKERFTKHGQHNTKIYAVWEAIVQRCQNSNHKNYLDYGGRGILICNEWRDDFTAFYEYVSNLPNFGEKGYSIDRINNDGNYEPGNVRWATQKEQIHNRRRNKNKEESQSV